MQPVDWVGKENVIPLLSVPEKTDIKAYGVDMKIQQFETALKNYKGDHLHATWLDYLAWVDQTFKTNTLLYQAKMIPVIERYVEFAKGLGLDLKHFLQLIEKYPQFGEEWFRILYYNKVAINQQLFYVAWAHFYEQSGQINKVAEVFQLGMETLKSNPVAVAFLTKKFNDFQSRIKREPRPQPLLPQGAQQYTGVVAPSSISGVVTQRIPLAPLTNANPLPLSQLQPQPQSQPPVQTQSQSVSQPQSQSQQIVSSLPSLSQLPNESSSHSSAPINKHVSSPLPTENIYQLAKTETGADITSKALNAECRYVKIRRLDDGRQEKINYDERFVYPNENEEFCFEEVKFVFFCLLC